MATDRPDKGPHTRIKTERASNVVPIQPAFKKLDPAMEAIKPLFHLRDYLMVLHKDPKLSALSYRQILAFLMIYTHYDKLRPVEISNAINVSSAALANTIDVLIGLRLIKREEKAEGQRKVFLSRTQEGIEFARKLLEGLRNVERK